MRTRDQRAILLSKDWPLIYFTLMSRGSRFKYLNSLSCSLTMNSLRKRWNSMICSIETPWWHFWISYQPLKTSILFLLIKVTKQTIHLSYQWNTCRTIINPWSIVDLLLCNLWLNVLRNMPLDSVFLQYNKKQSKRLLVCRGSTQNCSIFGL